MWIQHRLLKINWIDHITNINVIERKKKELKVVKTIKSRKFQYLRHVMQHSEKYSLLQLIMQGKIVAKRSRGRPQISWLDNLRKWFNISTIPLFRAAVNKDKITNMIINVR
jgi:hypothetical protein